MNTIVLDENSLQSIVLVTPSLTLHISIKPNGVVSIKEVGNECLCICPISSNNVEIIPRQRDYKFNNEK